MDIAKMLNHLRTPYICRTFLVLSTALILLLQGACSKKSHVVGTDASSPVRVALLPFNVPAGNKDLQWTAMAAPILMTKVGQQAKNLEIVPLWETMPIAITQAGASRSIGEESANNVAGWLSAKWSVMGELTPTKRGVSMVIDFIPVKPTMIAFRYTRNDSIETVGQGMYDAYNQFLRYLMAKPMEPIRTHEADMTAFKVLAEAFDREYGWSVEAEPGKAQDVVAGLFKSDELLARSLFNPGQYPLLAAKK